MKQYIDRNALLEELRNDLNNDINIYHSHTAKEIRDEKYEFAIERIEEAPIVDIDTQIKDILLSLKRAEEGLNICINIIKERTKL